MFRVEGGFSRIECYPSNRAVVAGVGSKETTGRKYIGGRGGG